MNNTEENNAIKKYITGDILICRGKRALSKTIMTATDSDWSHTAQIIVLDSKVYLFDAQSNGCCLRTFEYWCNKYDYEFKVVRPNIIREDYVSYMLQFSGVEYDKKGLAVGLFKSILNKVFGLFKSKDMKNKYRNNGKFWCSELTMKPYVTNPEDYSPNDVDLFFNENNSKFVMDNYSIKDNIK